MVKQPGERFQHHLAGQIEHLHKNLYLNRSDPMYYEKVLRYLDPASPEAHYRVGQKYESRGNFAKAADHYRQCLRQRSSDYANFASRALRRLEADPRENAEERREERPSAASGFPVKTAAFLLALILMMSIVLLVLSLRPGSVSATLSALKIWGVGRTVMHETVEVPYVFYFPYSASEKDIEDALFKETMELGRASPDRIVIVYGLAGESANREQRAFPMTNPDAAGKAFVVAQYQADQDRTVKIRFLNRDYRSLRPVTSEVGANMVRTALAAYMKDHGRAPSDVHELAADYPANYLSFVPVEPASKSNRIVSVYDGAGGWVYRPSARELGAMFVPNVPGFVTSAEQERFEPLRLLVDKAHHTMSLFMGDTAVLQAPVGLGANGTTPAGSFRVAERVLEPAGSKPGVYGAAALGLGDIAVHGTNDGASIGRDASLGCIRVADAQMSALYPFVPKGTEVIIVEAGETALAVPDADAVAWAALVPDQRSGPEERARGKRFTWFG